MPSQDPLAPPGSEGPFSRYLNAPLEGQAAEESRSQQRPSGFMGTTGKLAMFGSKLLEGLQRGKMMSYARSEQEKHQSFEAAANRVKALQEDPDVPNEVKAHASNLLAQTWSVKTKEQIQEIKKAQGKQGGAGSHVLGFFEHIADTLGGPTPAEHSFGGSKGATKDTASAFNQLNELLADVHTGGEKYSTKAQAQGLQTQLADKLKQYKEGYDLRGAETDPEVMKLRAKLHDLSPEQGKLADGSMRAGLTIPKQEETDQRRYLELVKQSGPINADGKPAKDDATVKAESPDFAPIRLPNGIVVKNPQDLQLVLRRDGGSPTKVLMKSEGDGPNGTSEKREGIAFMKMPGFVLDIATGKPYDTSKWKAVQPGDKDPAPHYVDVHGQGSTPGWEVIKRVELKPGEEIEYKPYSKPEKVRAGKAPDPIGEAIKELRLEKAADSRDDDVRKRNARSLTDKIMTDVHKDALQNGVKPSQILDQRIEDFMGYYESDPRFAGNFDTVRENLLKRKAELASSDAKAVAAARSRKKAEQEKAIPKKDTSAKGSPAKSDPKPAKQDKQAPPKEVTEKLSPGEHTFRNGQVWLKKSDGTVVYVRG